MSTFRHGSQKKKFTIPLASPGHARNVAGHQGANEGNETGMEATHAAIPSGPSGPIKDQKERRSDMKMRNPFKKPWGLQRDGDLWEQAWTAVIKRGAANQDLRKVKGHATLEDVQQGKATAEDKYGKR